MKKILHISKYYYPFRGGTEQIAQDCVKSLKGSFEQKVICFNHERGEKIDWVDDIEITRCDCIAKISSQSISISYSKAIKKTFETFRPDVVIFHYPNPFVCSILLKYLPFNVKLVVYWHLDIVKQRILGKLFIQQNKALVNRADLLLATSPNYIEGSPYLNMARNKCEVIPNCINEHRLQMSESAILLSEQIRERNHDKILCLAVGRHTEYKGFKYLIQASKKLDDRFVFCLAGEGEETKKLKKEAEGDSKVHFLGLISDEELKAYLNAMDIFCFPSITKNEAFGLALAEGMYYGKPAVTFTIPGSGVNYVCINGEDGLEVPNRDVESYAKAINELADNVALRYEMGEKAHLRVIQNFLDNQFNTNINKAIKKILS